MLEYSRWWQHLEAHRVSSMNMHLEVENSLEELLTVIMVDKLKEIFMVSILCSFCGFRQLDVRTYRQKLQF